MTISFIFASSNRGKFIEISEAAAEFDLHVIDPLTIRERCGEPPEVAETADSYLGNARLKAEAYHRWSGYAALADDTGLEVAALNNAPGLFTARYAGDAATAAQNRHKLMTEMEGVVDRRARFVCALVLVRSVGTPIESESTLEGMIAQSESGDGGFGYDSIFSLPSLDMTLAQAKGLCIPVETHRMKALRALFHALISGNSPTN